MSDDDRKNRAEARVSEFYDRVGWTARDGVTEDARRWEDLRDCARDYVRQCRLRILRHVPASGERMLDMASGPIQYPEYLAYSRGFRKRYCVDLSKDALREAELKIGSHGVFINQSFFDVRFATNMFDCTISMHTIYHIDRDLQEDAVRKLIRVTKPGQPVIIVYSNPLALVARVKSVLRKARRRVRNRGAAKAGAATRAGAQPRAPGDAREPGPYFHAHPLDWWERFGDDTAISILPWRSFTAKEQRALFPDNVVGRWLLRLLFALEDRFPRFFVRYFRYPLIVLRKPAPPASDPRTPGRA